jgi:hypothetical protein
MARSVWKVANNPDIVSEGWVDSVEDACTRVVDSDREANTPQGASMRKMDREDIIAGCTDVLAEEQELGYLP